ncbi:MAG: glycosyltransferase family 39 protein [Planctomycetaceae bacterium]
MWLLFFTFCFFQFVLPNNKPVSRLDIFTAIPEFLSDNIQALTDFPTVWQVLTERVPLGLISCGVVLSAVAMGRLLLRGLRLFSDIDSSARFALSGGLGLGALSLLMLGLGLLGFMSTMLLAVILGATVATEFALTLRRAITADNLTADSIPAAPQWFRHTAIAICGLFLLLIISGALLPSMDFDVKEYHLGGPKEYFRDGQISFLPHNVYTSFPFLTEMLSLTGMVLRNDWYWGAIVGKGILASFTLFTAAGLYAFVSRAVDESAGWLAATLYLTTPWVYRMSIIAYTEGALCCYVMLTLLAFDLAVRKSDGLSKNWPLLVGLLAGCAAATKYPGLVFICIPFGLAWIYVVWSRRSSQQSASAQVIFTYIAGALIAFSPWLAKNFWETGNPVYPFAWSIFGGADWNATLDAKFKAGHAAPTHLLTNPQALVFDLWEKIVDVTSKSDWQSPLMFGLIPLAWLAPCRERVRGVSLYALLFFLLWFFITHRIDRFWVPMLPLLCILAAIGARQLWKSWQYEYGHEGLPMPIVLTGVISSIATVVVVTVYHFVFATSGFCGPNNFVQPYEQVQQQAFKFTPLIAYLEQLRDVHDRNGDEPMRVLLVGEAQIFDLRGDYVYNTVFDTSLFEEWTGVPGDDMPSGERAMQSPEEVLAVLKEQGVTHVAVNWHEILRYRTTYGYTNYVTPARFNELVYDDVLTRLPTPATAYVETEQLSDSWQQQLRDWGPELVTRQGGRPAIPIFTVYEVRQQNTD